MQFIRSSLIASGCVSLALSGIFAHAASAQAPARSTAQPATSGSGRAKPAEAAPPQVDGEALTDATAAESARSAEVMAEAKQRFDRGFELYDEGEYPLALIEFSRAYELVPNYRVLYNIGQVCIQLGQYANARRALEEYRTKGGEGLNRERREAIAKDLQMLERRTAFLMITTNVEGAEVLVDDVPMGKTPLDPALLVDAGVHRVMLRRQGYQPRIASVTLAGGDEQTLALALEVQPEDKPTIVVRERAVEEDNSQTWIIAGWVTTGALVAGAVVTGLMGAGEADELEKLRGADPRDYEDLGARLDETKSNASSLLLASDVLSGAALIVGGLSLWITLDPLEGGTPPAEAESNAASATGLQVGFRESQIQLRGSF